MRMQEPMRALLCIKIIMRAHPFPKSGYYFFLILANFLTHSIEFLAIVI